MQHRDVTFMLPDFHVHHFRPQALEKESSMPMAEVNYIEFV